MIQKEGKTRLSMYYLNRVTFYVAMDLAMYYLPKRLNVTFSSTKYISFINVSVTILGNIQDH